MSEATSNLEHWASKPAEGRKAHLFSYHLLASNTATFEVTFLSQYDVPGECIADSKPWILKYKVFRRNT